MRRAKFFLLDLLASGLLDKKNRIFYGGKNEVFQIKLSLCMAWSCNGWVEIQLHPFWTSVGGGATCVTSSVTPLLAHKQGDGWGPDPIWKQRRTENFLSLLRINPNSLETARILATTVSESARFHKYEGLMHNSLYYVCVLIQLQTEYKTIGPICACYEDILKLGTRGRREVGFMLRPLYTGRNKSQYSLNERLDGNQSRSRSSKEDKNSYFLLQKKTSSVVQPVD